MNEGKTTWKWRKSCLCVGFPNGGETLGGNPWSFGVSEELAWNNQFLLTITNVKSFRSFPKVTLPIRRSACRGLVHTQGDHCMYSWSSSWQRGKQCEILIENDGVYPKKLPWTMAMCFSPVNHLQKAACLRTIFIHRKFPHETEQVTVESNIIQKKVRV